MGSSSISHPDWRDPEAYRHLASLDAPGFAWEFLRRNPLFQQERKKLGFNQDSELLNATGVHDFSRHWGIGFEDCAGNDSNPRAWTPLALPSVVAVIDYPAALRNSAFELSVRAISTIPNKAGEHMIEAEGDTLQIYLLKDALGAPAVLLPLDKLFDNRATAALRLWRHLTGRALGLDPARMSKAGSLRLVLSLRALDGWQERATYREIAGGLFPSIEISDSRWRTHDLRGRVRRLVRSGLRMMDGGYRQLLLYPYRRRS